MMKPSRNSSSSHDNGHVNHGMNDGTTATTVTMDVCRGGRKHWVNMRHLTSTYDWSSSSVSYFLVLIERVYGYMCCTRILGCKIV